MARTHSGLAVDPDVRKAYEMFMRDHRRMIGTLVHFSMIVFIVDKHMKSFYLECTNCSFGKNKIGAKLDTSELLEGWESTV